MSPPDAAAPAGAFDGAHVPAEPLSRLFLRFLRFGSLAWGGPVAQIAMLRQAFVEEEKWVTSERFNRVLAVYQVLPGPEAHELCVYFGMLSRGRIGGVLAGLGFMLPGFALMFLISWLYVRFGLDRGGALGVVFAAVQAAVAALIVRAVHRIANHVLLDPWLWAVAVIGLVAQLLGAHFLLILAGGGSIYLVARQRRPAIAVVFAVICVAALLVWSGRTGFHLQGLSGGEFTAAEAHRAPPGLTQLFLSGLKAGLLTFGGAYTAIPFLQQDAVSRGAWMSNAQFLDGIALSGLLPAPLIIFATFVGYVGGGAAGALLLTAGVFLPAFAFTLVAHDPLERIVQHPRLRTFLDGLMAAVVGLIAGTALTLLFASLSGVLATGVFMLALVAFFRWHGKLLVPLVIAAAAAFGWIASNIWVQ